MIFLGCDRAGYDLKLALMEYLKEKNLAYTDLGCNGETVDYPDVAVDVCKKVQEDKANIGVLCCGTGIGISMAANKMKGIRAAMCADYFSAKYTRLHNDANVICMGGRTIGSGLAVELLDVFLNTGFEGGRHQLRVDKINNIC